MAKQSKSSPLFILAAMITAVAALYFAKEIVLPIALATLLSFLLTPLANQLENWRVPRLISAVLVVAMSFSVLGLLGWIVTDQLVDLGRQLPENKQNLIAKTQWISDTVNKVLNEASRFGKLRPHTEDSASDQKPGTTADATTQNKSRPKNKNTQDHSSPIDTDVAKINKAGEIIEPPPEKEAAPVRIVNSSAPLDFIRGWLGPILSPLAMSFIVVVL